ncbi:MAG TPA: response regulator [Polyangiaceae bacterium]|nr:response regulator [Polyangiaceae bacterium]
MSKDPYRYFRVEARELVSGLSSGVLDLEKGPPTAEIVAHLLRLAHTLKGAARIVKQPAIAEAAHAIEERLTAHRDETTPLTRADASTMLALLDDVGARVDALDVPAEAGRAEAGRAEAGRAEQASTEQAGVEPIRAVPAIAPVEDSLETTRIETRDLDALLRGATETAVQVGSVKRQLARLERLRSTSRQLADQIDAVEGPDGSRGSARKRAVMEDLRLELDAVTRELRTEVERVESSVIDIRDGAHRLRLTPARALFPTLERVARDAAAALGRRVSFETSGGDVRLDKAVLAEVRDALTHVVRNAVTHGIEPEEARIAAGKPALGRITITVRRVGGRATLECRDDGRGVDLDGVRRAAVRSGRLSEEAARALDPDEVLALLRSGGLSTSSRVTELSGRGIGMDVVRAAMARLKGELDVASELGRGTAITVVVPVSIASLKGLVVEVGGTAAIIPLDAVRATLRVLEGEIVRTAANDSIVHDGEVLPFVRLDRALGQPAPQSRGPRDWSAVVVRASGRGVAVGVDRLLRTSQVVMRALPEWLDADEIVAGAAIDEDGAPQLVLDPGGLVASGERAPRGPVEITQQPPLPILVVDDSLTTRMLEKSILESAGFEVALAVSGEEGLARAREQAFGLFLVDVEMPGMDGFTFVTETRADPALRSVPAILVTSRNAPEDRRRGEQAGAAAYIVKGEFDQGELLRTIRKLTGAE